MPHTGGLRPATLPCLLACRAGLAAARPAMSPSDGRTDETGPIGRPLRRGGEITWFS
jgi:hypothetical protein